MSVKGHLANIGYIIQQNMIKDHQFQSLKNWLILYWINSFGEEAKNVNINR